MARARARFLYTGLRVRSVRRATRIYRALGMRPILRGSTPLGEYVQLASPGSTIALELNFFKRGSPAYEPFRPGTELDHLGFWVDDVDRWATRLCRLGCHLRFRPFDSGIALPGRPLLPGRAAYLIDPDGFWIELMGPRRPSSTKRPRAPGPHQRRPVRKSPSSSARRRRRGV